MDPEKTGRAGRGWWNVSGSEGVRVPHRQEGSVRWTPYTRGPSGPEGDVCPVCRRRPLDRDRPLKTGRFPSVGTLLTPPALGARFGE